jgi:hypothetical protein
MTETQRRALARPEGVEQIKAEPVKPPKKEPEPVNFVLPILKPYVTPEWAKIPGTDLPGLARSGPRKLKAKKGKFKCNFCAVRTVEAIRWGHDWCQKCAEQHFGKAGLEKELRDRKEYDRLKAAGKIPEGY